MANEQTSVPLYAAAEVLTAANMNISAGTGVPVFANTTTRDAAFGGAGEKVLAEGQLCYLSDSNIVQYYSGASWATVGPSTAGGLVCVKAETAFSAVTSFSADGIFTSSYTNYRMICRFTGTTDGAVSMQLRASTTPATSNYNYQRLTVTGGVSTPLRTTAAANFAIGFGSTGSFMESFWLELTGPQLAQATSFNSIALNSDTSYEYPNYYQTLGNNSNSTAYDGFAVSVATGTMTGSYTVYGYAKTV
jgi:hypothetical protein